MVHAELFGVGVTELFQMLLKGSIGVITLTTL